MADIFGSLVEGYDRGRQRKRESQQQDLENALKYAQLQEAGYTPQRVQTPGLFGTRLFGGNRNVLAQDPNTVSLKSLQRQKMINELDPNWDAKQAAAKETAVINARRQAFGGGASPSGNEGSGTSTSAFIIDPVSGRSVRNPDHLNALDQEKLNALKSEKQADVEAEKNKENMLRQDAESQLNAIKETKKGIKYFGMMGNVPSQFAPSTITSLGKDYGPRKEWENNVNKLLSGRIISLMNQMKSASKTGATGFGQLNKSELNLIQNASNVLSKDLPPDVAMKYLNQLEPIYQKMLAGGGAPKQSGVVHVDAQGNKAIVYSDGSYEEIQ